MKLYNTLTRKLEDFVPFEDGKATFYHCGPTVYWTQHIGNLRGMTMGDILVRTLRRFGYHVTHVRNYTDVGHLTSDADTGEDKMEKGAKREGLTPDAIAEKYITIFEDDTKSLNLVEPNFKPRPSQLIPEIIEMVKILMDKGFAYATDYAVYFDVSKFPNYTKLSRQKLDQNVGGAGKGEAEDPKKKHFSDFALWIFKKGSHANALQTWDSPWGVGFPGWHIECSVMAKKYLGNTVDIHMGGVEHIPIHHTNEIAQSESANGVAFVRYWLHNEHLVVNQEKMAKSKGTGLSVAEVEERGFDPLALRYLYLTAHYRTRQNFTWEALGGAQSSLNELRARISNIKNQISNRKTLSQEKLEKVDTYRKQFDAALAGDLNTPQALAVVWEALKSNIPSQDKYDVLLDFDEVLGLRLAAGDWEHGTAEIPDEVTKLGEQLDALRKTKKFIEADAVRTKIISEGFKVETTPHGTKITK
ncbi:MAG TPA: cysteine--tRNA ligase [Patescibacteria group bacterium]|nr:cysteine--tRNA ligase [Patescibacteria group bacterium]